MPRLLFIPAILAVLLAAAPPEAWAQAAELRCEGANCPEVTRKGAWGLIILGVMFFAIFLMPPRRASEKGVGFMDSLPIMGALQRRIDKELTGWRRFQWPLIGLFFLWLGFAFLFGWL